MFPFNSLGIQLKKKAQFAADSLSQGIVYIRFERADKKNGLREVDLYSKGKRDYNFNNNNNFFLTEREKKVGSTTAKGGRRRLGIAASRKRNR